MPKGISFHFGVPTPRGVCCTYRTLEGPAGDAEVMASIAKQAGFSVSEPLIGDAVTVDAIRHALHWAACALGSNDILLLTYSGHGCPAIDFSGPPELAGYFETWCLADGQLAEFELHQELAAFQPGVRVIIVSECCHSGAVYVYNADHSEPLLPATPAQIGFWKEYRSQVIEARKRELRLGESAADLAPQLLPRRAERIEIKARVMLLAACADLEEAKDDTPRSLFTSELIKAWEGLTPQGSYAQFITKVHDEVSIKNSLQHPGIAFVGAKDPAFLAQLPFRVS
jgi:hypothetical protein